MDKAERYVFRPVVLCAICGFFGLLLLGAGLKQIMTLEHQRMLLGVVLLIAAGFLLVAIYLLSRCAVIIDDQGVRVCGIAGERQEIRWSEVVEITLRAEPRQGRMGGAVMLVIRSRSGETVEVIRNERTQAMLRWYCPVPVPE